MIFAIVGTKRGTEDVKVKQVGMDDMCMTYSHTSRLEFLFEDDHRAGILLTEESLLGV